MYQKPMAGSEVKGQGETVLVSHGFHSFRRERRDPIILPSDTDGETKIQLDKDRAKVKASWGQSQS